MMRIRIKDNVDLKELENYGFEFADGYYQYTRIIDGVLAWKAYITKAHHNLQITVYEPCIMARELQRLIYYLTKDGLLEEVKELEYKAKDAQKELEYRKDDIRFNCERVDERMNCFRNIEHEFPKNEMNCERVERAN